MRAGSFRCVHVDAAAMPVRQNDPTGKSLLIYGNRVKPQNKKYFCLPEGKSGAYVLAIPSYSEGVGRRHGRWTGCGGRWFTPRRRRGLRRTAKPCGPGTRCRCQAVGEAQAETAATESTRTRLRGDHGISRKAIAQGRPGVLRCPVCSCAAFFVQTAHETAGAARTRSSLRPLFGGQGISGKARAQCVARSRSRIHCLKLESEVQAPNVGSLALAGEATQR